MHLLNMNVNVMLEVGFNETSSFYLFLVALEDADGMRIEGRKIFVDVERGRTVDSWRPRRLGGGAGTKRLYPAKKPAKTQPVPSRSTSKRPRSNSREREREPRRRY